MRATQHNFLGLKWLTNLPSWLSVVDVRQTVLESSLDSIQLLLVCPLIHLSDSWLNPRRKDKETTLEWISYKQWKQLHFHDGRWIHNKLMLNSNKNTPKTEICQYAVILPSFNLSCWISLFDYWFQIPLKTVASNLWKSTAFQEGPLHRKTLPLHSDISCSSRGSEFDSGAVFSAHV